jgi:hypothetical protein
MPALTAGADDDNYFNVRTHRAAGLVHHLLIASLSAICLTETGPGLSIHKFKPIATSDIAGLSES